MSQNRNTLSRARRPLFQAEALEGRQLLTVDFSVGLYTVAAQSGAVSITLENNGPPIAPDIPPALLPPATQVTLSLGGGTAVPGVDYTPESQTISFAAGEASKTVQIPVLPAPASDGTRVVDLFLSDTQGSPPTAGALLVITHNADTIPPQVIASKVLTKGPNVTGFVLTFSKDMALGPVQDVSNYAVSDPRSARVVKGAELAYDSRKLPLKSAVYDPATHSVTLTLAGKVRKYPVFTIEDSGTFNTFLQVAQSIKQKAQPSPAQFLPEFSPITDTTGNLLDGSGDGTPSGNLIVFAAQGKAGHKFVNQLNQFPSSPPTPPVS